MRTLFVGGRGLRSYQLLGGEQHQHLHLLTWLVAAGTSSPSGASADAVAKRTRASTDGEAAEDAPGGGDPWSSVKAAYNFYSGPTMCYVVHSVNITSQHNAGGVEKKQLSLRRGISWRRDNSTFVPGYNSLAIDCGRSGIIVLDVDLPALAAWADIEAEAGGPFDTFTVRSGSGGLHLYFRAFEDAQLNRSIAKQFKLNGVALDIDVRGHGGCIIAPPSGYTSLFGERRNYVVEKDMLPAEMPQRLVAKLKAMLPAAPRRSLRQHAADAGGALAGAPASRIAGACSPAALARPGAGLARPGRSP